MSIRCPACGKENKDDARACAFCPESFEFEDDPYRVKRERRRIDPASWPPAVWFAILAGAGFGAWRGMNWFMTLGEEGVKNPLNQMVQYRTSVPEITDNRMPGTGNVGPAKVTMHLRKDQGKPGDWKFTGKVVNIVTLAGVGDVKMTFKSGGVKVDAETDEDGKYEVYAPPAEHGGYFVTLKKEGYAKTYLNPAVENVPAMGQEDREGLAHDLAAADEGPYEVQPSGEEPLNTEFFVAPLPEKKKAE